MVHADIKPDNVLIGYPSKLGDPNLNEEELNTLYLIDYGLSVHYVLEDGMHKPLGKAKRFVGNVGFASKHSFA